jgi:hypothetical protein
MTPFELSLQNELGVEQQRFGNEWLFKWYSLNMEGRMVDVPSFDGGRISIGGFLFEGQAQSIYWQAIGRYLHGKVHEIFQRWDQQTISYPAALRRSSLDGTERLLGHFVAGVMERANETDQALRRRGSSKTDKALEGSGVHSRANAEIHLLTLAHRALMPAEISGAELSIWRRVVEALNLKPGFTGMSIDLKKLFTRRVK